MCRVFDSLPAHQSIAGNKFRQVLLIDGPGVLGWEKWREIDARYFGGVMKAPMDARVSAREMAAIGHLIAGAVSEAALVCATSDHPRARRARLHFSAAQDARTILSMNGRILLLAD